MLIIILLPLNVGKVAVLALETLCLSSTKPIREEGLLRDVDREKQRTGLPTRTCHLTARIFNTANAHVIGMETFRSPRMNN
jgi:hypothetical protein